MLTWPTPKQNPTLRKEKPSTFTQYHTSFGSYDLSPPNYQFQKQGNQKPLSTVHTAQALSPELPHAARCCPHSSGDRAPAAPRSWSQEAERHPRHRVPVELRPGQTHHKPQTSTNKRYHVWAQQPKCQGKRTSFKLPNLNYLLPTLLYHGWVWTQASLSSWLKNHEFLTIPFPLSLTSMAMIQFNRHCHNSATRSHECVRPSEH